MNVFRRLSSLTLSVLLVAAAFGVSLLLPTPMHATPTPVCGAADEQPCLVQVGDDTTAQA